MAHTYLTDMKPIKVSGAISSGTGTTTTTGVDNKYGTRFRWYVVVGSITSTGTITCSIEGSTDGTNYSAVTPEEGGTAETVVTDDTAGGKILLLEVVNPDPNLKKLRLKIVRAVANSDIVVAMCHVDRLRVDSIASDSNCLPAAHIYGATV